MTNNDRNLQSCHLFKGDDQTKSYLYKGRFQVKYPFRVKDNSYASGYHCGVDLVGLDGDKDIYAVNDGKIVLITTNDDYGNHVVQTLPDGRFFYYSHLSKMLVKVGDKVIGGETQIGIEGSSGRATGSHLDARISKYSYHTNNVNDFSSVPEYLGFANTDELIILPKTSVSIQTEVKKMTIPTGSNITPLNGNVGWIETKPERVIIHYDANTYICIWDGKITLHAKGKEAKQLI
ncbi:M23 family metallopeptidase [Dehalobacter restrictus]|uniref:M23 family metallopeptidase n=1 Tax=Dehalobacter restrictus TaxID=55583 RepID=UPI00249ED551|nr:M23 family metallopeptidase [Dehalobacter restrictus]